MTKFPKLSTCANVILFAGITAQCTDSTPSRNYKLFEKYDAQKQTYISDIKQMNAVLDSTQRTSSTETFVMNGQAYVVLDQAEMESAGLMSDDAPKQIAGTIDFRRNAANNAFVSYIDTTLKAPVMTKDTIVEDNPQP
jgi:hypothetical protein